ncbi:tetratricopeptide repeat protein [Bacteroides ndongoniae]|uniref:tetratricopeptide repeat protein n=1 Tax=Bacteroides ndongoniae TaxID=1903262 RepID=UPI0023F6B283|nr:tetratricopeptide repeat protein [Bacteroides ndongoniae]
MKIKTLVAAVLLLSGGATSVFAQNDCNANSSISHEAVNAKNYKDAYAPCMAVLKECPTLRYYTFKDAIEILQNFLQTNKDRNSADYKKYFDELMEVHDLKIKYLPEFATKYKSGIPSEATALGTKAIDYLMYAPSLNLDQAYNWLKESVTTGKGEVDGAVLHYFLDVSMQKVKADSNHTDQFFQDYLDASKYIEEAIANETKPNKKKNLEAIKENLVAMFVNSGVADCESLQNIYGPKVEANQSDSTFLKKTIAILKMMKCNESEVYFKASDYLYRIDPSADAAVGVAYMYYKKGEYDNAVKYFDEALGMETDNAKKAEMSYATAAALFSAKKLSQARSYCQKALSFKEDYGQAYIMLAHIYASNPKWSDEPALNKCTYFLVIDKLQKAKSIDPSVAEEANKLISTYSAYTPQAKDLFMLGYKAGDRVTIGGWIGESTTIR